MAIISFVPFNLEFPTEEERKKKGDSHSNVDLPCFFCTVTSFDDKTVALGVRVFYVHLDTTEIAQSVEQLFSQCGLYVQQEGSLIRIGVCQVHLPHIEQLHKITSTDHHLTKDMLWQVAVGGKSS